MKEKKLCKHLLKEILDTDKQNLSRKLKTLYKKYHKRKNINYRASWYVLYNTLYMRDSNGS